MSEITTPDTTASSPDNYNDGQYAVQYAELKKLLRLKLQKPFTKTKIFVLVAAGIKFAEDLRTMTGPQKKDLVLHAIRDVIQCSDTLLADEKEVMLDLLDTVGDVAIDTLVEFGRDTVTFVKTGCAKVFTCCTKGK